MVKKWKFIIDGGITIGFDVAVVCVRRRDSRNAMHILTNGLLAMIKKDDTIVNGSATVGGCANATLMKIWFNNALGQKLWSIDGSNTV
jgi:hypothetical protein